MQQAQGSRLPMMSIWMCHTWAAYASIYPSICAHMCAYAVPDSHPHWMVGVGVALKADVFDGFE